MNPMTPQEHVLAARARNDWAWQYHHCMSAADRTAFDAWLVAGAYPLAFEPGTTEGRFRRLEGANDEHGDDCSEWVALKIAKAARAKATEVVT